MSARYRGGLACAFVVKARKFIILDAKHDLNGATTNFAILNIGMSPFDGQINNHRNFFKTIRTFKFFFDFFHNGLLIKDFNSKLKECHLE